MKPPEWLCVDRDFGRYLSSTGRSPQTCRTYLTNLEMFRRFCARYEVTPIEADRRMLRAYLSERLDTVSSNRAHNDLVAIRHFYAFAIEDGMREDDPSIGAKVKRAATLPTKPLDVTEIDRLIAGCEDERERMIILVLAATGMRISELASLTADCIDWANGEIRIKGKGDKERRLAPRRDVLDRLHAFCGMFPEGPVWRNKYTSGQLTANSLRKVIYAIAARAGIDDVHPHRLRASFGTQYVEQFSDIQALQGVMGHSSIQTTARYTEWTKEKRGLRQMRELDFGIRSA